MFRRYHLGEIIFYEMAPKRPKFAVEATKLSRPLDQESLVALASLSRIAAEASSYEIDHNIIGLRPKWWSLKAEADFRIWHDLACELRCLRWNHYYTLTCALSVALVASFWSLSIPLSSMLSICCIICEQSFICTTYGISKSSQNLSKQLHRAPSWILHVGRNIAHAFPRIQRN